MNMSKTLRRPFHSASHSISAIRCNKIWEEIKLQQISHQAAPILPLWTSRWRSRPRILHNSHQAAPILPLWTSNWRSRPRISHKANSNWRSRSRRTAFLPGLPSVGRLSPPSGLAKTLRWVEVLPSEYAVCVLSSHSIAQSNGNQCCTCGHWIGHGTHLS